MIKKMILFLMLCFSIQFSQTLYIGYDLSADGEYSDGPSGTRTYDFEDGSILIGYDHEVFTKGIYGLSLGLSYMVSPLKIKNQTWPSSPHEMKFTSVYFLSTFAINDQLYFWAPLGYNIIEGEDPNTSLGNISVDDYDGGLTYGYGISYKIKNKYTIGFGKIINTASYEGGGGATQEDYSCERTTILLGYSF